MATISTALPRTLTRPRPNADYRSRSVHRTLGILLGVTGVGLATIALIANFAGAAAVDATVTAATVRGRSG